VFLPREIFPDMLSSTVAAGALPFGKKVTVLALLGVLACLSGAAVETAMSGGYNICQFFNLPWGKNLPHKKVKEFTASWVIMFVIAAVLAVTGLKPLQLVNISVIFGMVIMPFTYWPILRAASDKKLMGKHVNDRSDDVIAWIFLALITIAAIAAIPLMVLTHSGQP
jgi:manganese transport protein